MGKASRQKKQGQKPAKGQPPGAGHPSEISSSRRRPPRIKKTIRLLDDQAPLWAHYLALLSLAALCLLIYYPSLSGEFVFDDHNAIQQSLLVRKIFPLSRFLTKSNRFLVDFSYALNYAQGGYDTWWYHFTNIALHFATALALYWLALRTFRLPRFGERLREWIQPAAWIAAALFACHPLATDSVAYITSRSEVLAAIFYLLAMVAYSFSATGDTPRQKTLAKVAIGMLTLLALASKEIAVTIPLAFGLYHFIFISEAGWADVKKHGKVAVYSLIPLAIGGIYLLNRASTLNTPYQQSAGFGFDRYTSLQYLSTQFGVVLHYLRLVVVPSGLNFDYDWPLVETPFSLAAILPMLVLMALVTAAIRLARAQPFVSFAILFMLLVLAPTSSIMPLADLCVERRMYIPLAGIALCTAGFSAISVRQWSRGVSFFVAPCVVVLAILAGLSHQRATLWGDHLLLYEDGVAKSPGSPRVRLNLGVIHMNAGRHEEAHEVLVEAKRIYDEGKSIHAFPRIGAFIHYNLGAIQFIREEYDQSEQQMRRALQIGGHYVALRPRAYSVLGHIFKLREQWKAAEESFLEALKLNRDYPEWSYSLAEVRAEQGRFLDAEITLRQTARRYPDNQDPERTQQIRARIKTLRLESKRAKRAQRGSAPEK